MQIFPTRKGRRHLLHSVVVVYADVHVVAGRDEPLLADDEACAPNGQRAHLERLHQRARLQTYTKQTKQWQWSWGA